MRYADHRLLFAFSYAAVHIFQVAKELGCRTVLGQIDPGPMEMRIVGEIEAQSGDVQTEWPSSNYWDAWREECRLAILFS